MIRYPYDLNDEPGRRVFDARLHQLVTRSFAGLSPDEQARRGAGGMAVHLDGDDVRVELPAGELLAVISVPDLLDSEPHELAGVYTTEVPDDPSQLLDDREWPHEKD